jgi:hypothetical protein
MKQHIDQHQLPSANQEASSRRDDQSFPWSRFWTALGIFVLFFAAVIVLMLWNPQPLDEDAERALLRAKNLKELQEANEKRLNNYGWVDQAKGVVSIPIVRAMELEVVSLNDPKWKPHAAYSIAPIDLIPKPSYMVVPSS